MYVGYGKTAQRAISHTGGSHNRALSRWLARNEYDLKIAGPYFNEREAKAVESALISSISPKFNIAAGDGPKFVPVGVPAHLSERASMPHLGLKEVGVQANGALIVYLAPGDYLRDGRRKFDPAVPNDRHAFKNIEKNWDITALIQEWERRPELAPRTLIGVHGKVDHRFVVGAFEIDRANLCHPRNKRFSDRWPRHRWRVPVIDPENLDYRDLRGRRVSGATFGQFSHQLHIWIDAKGRRRH